MKINRKQKRGSFKILIIVLIGALSAWAVFSLLAELSKEDGKTDDASQSQEKINDINSNNLGNEDLTNLDSSEDKEQSGGSDKPSDPILDQASGLEIVDMVLNFAGETQDGTYIEASGTILNSTDNTGTCQYIFKGPDNKVMTLESKPFPSASSMACSTVRQNLSNFAKGKWTVKLQYKSDYSKGESANELDFEIK